MNKNIIYIKEELTQEELKLIKGCLLTTKETLKCMPFKNNNVKDKIKKIEELLKKFLEGS